MTDHLHKSGEPLRISVGSTAEIAIPGADACQLLKEQADRLAALELIEALREGLADVEAGHTQPARQAILEIAAQYGLDLKEN
jgi:hypothetical protein